MILEGKKVRLRPLEEQDLDSIMEWTNDHEVTRTLLMGRYPMTRQEEGRLRQRVFKDGAYQDIVSMSMLPSEWLAGRAA